jgi:hypothetical protein
MLEVGLVARVESSVGLQLMGNTEKSYKRRRGRRSYCPLFQENLWVRVQQNLQIFWVQKIIGWGGGMRQI